MSDKLQMQKELFAAAKQGEATGFINKFGKELVRNDAISSIIEAQMIESESHFGTTFREQFNRAYSRFLGGDYKVEILNEDEQKAAEVEAEKFAQTAYASGGGNTPITGLIATTLTPIMDKYFYDSDLLSRVTILQEGTEDQKITDFTNDRTATVGNETQNPAAVDNNESVDTLSPAINIQDKMEISYLFRELKDPVQAALMLARMQRAVRNRVDALIIGDPAAATNGANQFYSILNNLAATGVNRGSINVPVVGVGVANHVDAINYVLGQMPLFDASSLQDIAILGRWDGINRVMRTLDANNQYYFDATSRTTRSLQNGGQMVINQNMPANVIGCFDLKNYQVKFAHKPRLRTVEGTNLITLVYEVNADGGLGMAYKATGNKNGFRHFTIEVDNNYAT